MNQIGKRNLGFWSTPVQKLHNISELFGNITVCSEIRSYTGTERTQAPQDSNQYFAAEG